MTLASARGFECPDLILGDHLRPPDLWSMPSPSAMKKAVRLLVPVLSMTA